MRAGKDAIILELRALTDPRFAVLAELMGLQNPHHALGEVLSLWFYAKQHGTDLVPRTVCQRFVNGLFLVQSGLAENVANDPDSVRLKGLRDIIERAACRSRMAHFAGKASAIARKRTDRQRNRTESNGTLTDSNGPFRAREHARTSGDGTSPNPLPTVGGARSGGDGGSLVRLTPGGDSAQAGDRDEQQRKSSGQPPAVEPAPECYELAELLRARILDWQPGNRACSERRWRITRKRWARDFALAHCEDQRSFAELARIVEFAQGHVRFWRARCLTAASIRKNFDQVDADSIPTPPKTDAPARKVQNAYERIGVLDSDKSLIFDDEGGNDDSR